jgi:AcrR family transcriptional regulator
VARTVGSNAPETRRRILDSAAAVFAEHGYSGSSMRDIAERLGITKAALYYHFESKEDLLYGLVHPVMQAMDDFAQAAESGIYTAAQIVRGYLDTTLVGVPGLFPLMTDPGAREAIKARYDLQELTRRIEAALAATAAAASSPERLLCSQFVLGGLRSLILTRLFSSAAHRCEPAKQAEPASGEPAAGESAPESAAAQSVSAQPVSARPAPAQPASPQPTAVSAPASRRPGIRIVSAEDPLLSDAECEIVVKAALAGLGTVA